MLSNILLLRHNIDATGFFTKGVKVFDGFREDY